MTYPASLLIHLANLETSSTAGSNAWGATGTPVYTQISCRFGKSRTSFQNQDSGDRVTKAPVCIVPSSLTITEGKKLVGLTAPFTKTYRIKQVTPAMVADSVSHYVLDLEVVS